MKVVFSKYASLELEDSIRFYELEYKGLGRRFKKEVKKAVIRISEYPEAWLTGCYATANLSNFSVGIKI